MDTVLAETRIADVWDCAQTQLGGSEYTIVEQGGMNQVLLVNERVGDQEPAYVIKLPRPECPDGSQYTTFEANVVRYLNQAPESPPVQIPRLLASSEDPDALPWNAFSYVRGDVLSYSEIRNQFSKPELERLGHDVGKFILWFSNTVSLDTCASFNPPPALDREKAFLLAAEQALALDKTAHPTLQRLGDYLKFDYEAYKELCAFQPPDMVGSDDLRPENLTFARQGEGWRLSGVFDFGLVKPTTVSREARHIYLLGREIGQHTVRAATGVSPHRPVVFIPEKAYVEVDDMACQWAYMQAFTVLIYRVTHHLVAGSKPVKLDTLGKISRDWTELERELESWANEQEGSSRSA